MVEVEVALAPVDQVDCASARAIESDLSQPCLFEQSLSKTSKTGKAARLVQEQVSKTTCTGSDKT